jgi:hypothetical protein
MKRYLLIPVTVLCILAQSACNSFNPSPEQITALSSAALTAAQIAAQFRDDSVYRAAICIGVYSDSIYGYCDGADLDATRDATTLQAIGFDQTNLILNGDATRQHIIDVAYATVANLKPNDLLYIKASSHGGQSPDQTGQEADDRNEYFCAADGPLLDNDIWTLLCLIPADVRVILAFDTCNSGTMARHHRQRIRAMQRRIVNANTTRSDTLKCSLLYIGGCSDGKISYGNKQTGGQLSYTMLATLPYSPTYAQWGDNIKAAMPPDQIPVIAELGPTSFSNLTPLY